MSDLNDDLLNYELGELGDDDDLLLSDDESSPTKLSQQDEALLLDDDEDDLLAFPESSALSQPTSNVSPPVCVALPASSAPGATRPQSPPAHTHSHESRDDSVTTTTPEPTTSKPMVFQLTPSPSKQPPLSQHHETDHSTATTPKLNRATLKRNSTGNSSSASTTAVPPVGLQPQQSESNANAADSNPNTSSTTTTTSTNSSSDSKKLRVDAPEFVPKTASSSQSSQQSDTTATTTRPFHTLVDADPSAASATNNDETIIAMDAMSFVSTSSEFVDLQDTDEFASQATLDESSSIGQQQTTKTTNTSQGAAAAAAAQLRRRRSPVQRRRRDSNTTATDDGGATTDDQMTSSSSLRSSGGDEVTRTSTTTTSKAAADGKSAPESTESDSDRVEPVPRGEGGGDAGRGEGTAPADMETDDGSDDGYERLNPKHRVERDRGDTVETYHNAPPPQFYRNQRGGSGGGSRGGYGSGPRNNQRYPPYGGAGGGGAPGQSGNENFNPQYPPSGRGVGGPSLLMNPHSAPMCVGGAPPNNVGPPLMQYHGSTGMPPHAAQHPQHMQQPRPGFRPMYNNDNRSGVPSMMGGPSMSAGPGVPMHMHGHRPPPYHQQQMPPGVPFPPFNGHGPPMRPHMSGGGPPPNMGPRFDHRPMPPHMMGAGPGGYMHQQPVPRMPYGGGGPPPVIGGLMPTPPPSSHVDGGPGGPLMGVVRPQMGPGPMGSGGGGPLAMPRKVLINPNFKGGVQAATNQLMLDTMKGSSHYMPPMLGGGGGGGPITSRHDDELLRQQEAFINQNRIHIEKRRHERSPERDHRDRSYSPPSAQSSRRDRRAYSRERDAGRKPTAPSSSGGGGGGAGGGGNSAAYRGGGGEARGRRAGSREPPHSSSSIPSKRRKSASAERERPAIAKEEKHQEPEDAETRAYRLEIEKQKLQREKLLRDKEMRRRKAAEDLKNTTATVTPAISSDAPASAAAATADNTSAKALSTPVSTPPVASTDRKQLPVVLKKKPIEGRSNIPTAKVFPEAKRPAGGSTTAVVKPVVKAHAPKPLLVVAEKPQPPSSHHIEFDEDVDELLADSPSTSPKTAQAPPTKALGGSGNGGASAGVQTARFTNRRVVLKSSSDAKTVATEAPHVAAASRPAVTTKGIFDRLERKVVNVTEAGKRKIQRIVVQNTTE